LTAFVLDCSVAMSWFFEDEISSAGQEAFQALRDSEALVPAIWPFEIGNSLAVAERRRRCTPADSASFLRLLSSLPIRVEAAPTGRAMDTVLSVARESGLSAYDAAYLDLAMREGLPLSTHDKRLRDASQRLGVAPFRA
jgi:predicted nucleic acid-binding protein